MGDQRKPVRYGSMPETVGYAFKRVFLGKPLITAQLKTEKLSNLVALGALSPDAISSSAYGTEEILIELLPYAGLAAFSLVLPITGVILVILVLVVASYRNVLMAYTKAGGSYVVARENFGPRVAQVAAAALLIDYVVTVAVQVAAGTVAVVSAIPALGPYSLEISVGMVLLMCYLNLRGLREAGTPFAIPTYFFTIMIGGMILVGVIRVLFFGGLPQIDAMHLPGAYPVHHADGLVMGASILVVLRAFANGGSSLTGVEAISNTVSALREPAAQNGRKILTVMACVLGFLVAGVSFLAFVTHATPFTAGYPSVLSEEARVVFGNSETGHVLFYLVQVASALILFTGANTSFNGFPFLASFVAEDRFLPRQLTTRGHRLVFSNGIILLAVLAVLLLIVTGGSVNSLVPFYAIGVFTGFAMAGFGMAKHQLTRRERHWHYRLAVNLAAGILSTIVVGIFAVAKFTEGAWLVVVVFPILVFILIRLNREYRAEAAILEKLRPLEPSAPENEVHKVFLLVGSVDIAVVEALRYARGLHASEITAVHFLIDETVAERVQRRWERIGFTINLEVIDCPDRRIGHAAQRLVLDALADDEDTRVTVLLPRRSYAPILGRLLHDRTADHMARGISRIPGAVATIIPYDVQAHIREAFPNLPEERITRRFEQLRNKMAHEEDEIIDEQEHPDGSPGTVSIDALVTGRTATLEGRVHSVEHVTGRGSDAVRAEVTDESGTILLECHAGTGKELQAGELIRVVGKPRQRAKSHVLVMTDPQIEVLSHESADAEDETDTGQPESGGDPPEGSRRPS